MLKNSIKIAVRFLWRKKIYSVLNFICLTFGLTCAIISVLYIRNVFSYDKFHKNYNRLYAVDAYVTYFNGDRFPKEYLSASLSDMLKVQAPEIEKITRIAKREYSFTYDDKAFKENGFYADDNFFDIFTFPIRQGGSITVLTEPNSIAISARMAIKLFESTDCVGKDLILKAGSKNEMYKVSAVFQDVRRQSLLQFDFVIPFPKFLAGNKWASEAGSAANETWILLKNTADYKFVQNKIKNLIKNQEATLNQELFLFPFKEQILYSYSGGKRIWREMENIIIVGAIGFAILLIACFNYINLSIALNFRRYRETGIRKVSGSGKSTIILQFLGETLTITLISFLTAIILVQLLLVGFNKIFNYNIHLQLLDFNSVSFFIAITLFTSIISGLLPALYLASTNPIDTLKGKLITGHSYSIFRQSLIVFQFTIPIVLIICMMIIKVQDSYMRNYDIGVDQDKLIILDNSKNIQLHAESVKRELLAIPGIDAVSFTNCIPGRGAKVTSDLTWEGQDVTEKPVVWCVSSDFDYNKTVKITMSEGRFFNPSFSTDSTSYLINDVTARVMKKENPIGSIITLDGQKGTIIGVFKDFHSIDLAGPITPTIIAIRSDYKPIILVKYSKGSFQGITGEIKKVYQHYESEAPFKATLFRDLPPFSNLSSPTKLVGIAFIIALLLACMGFFGLASFTAENRTKEIGIRKANGATTSSVMILLLASFTKWLIIAFVIAVPVAFLAGKSFLGRFYFHAPLPLWAFIAGPVIALVVALFTVTSRTWTVANQNPVKALRYE